jgi:hypothetical protein
MAKLTDDQRRALLLLARSPNGCTEALLMAHGFEVAMLGKLVLDGFALATPHETRAGSRPMIVVWITISPAGRKAIATKRPRGPKELAGALMRLQKGRRGQKRDRDIIRLVRLSSNAVHSGWKRRGTGVDMRISTLQFVEHWLRFRCMSGRERTALTFHYFSLSDLEPTISCKTDAGFSCTC